MVWISPALKRRQDAERRRNSPLFPKWPEWQKCFELFLDKVEARCGSKVSRRTHDGYLRWFFADGRNPNDYRQQDVLEFISQPTNGPSSKGAPPKPATYNGRLLRVRGFYRFAARYKVPYRNKSRFLLQGDDPTEGLEQIKDPGVSKTLTDDEIRRFFSVIDTTTVAGVRDRCIFLFYFWTGKRLSSIANLRYGDIKEAIIPDENGGMHQGYLFYFREKGGKVGYAELVQPLPQVLDDYLTISERKATIKAADPLFVGTKNCPPNTAMQGRSIDHRFRRYAKLAGFDEKHSIHSWRHTAADRRWKAELASGHPDLLRLMRWMGHEDPKTTLRYLRNLVQVADPIASQLLVQYGNL